MEKPTIVHRVLRVNGFPVLSREHDDPNADEDFAAQKALSLQQSLARGEARPKFRESVELGGVEYKSLAAAVKDAEANKPKPEPKQ